MEGTNPVPEVEHVDEQLPRTLYTVNFYDVLSLLPRPRQPQSWETQEHSRLPPPVLPRTRPELRRKDFLKQQQRIHALLLQEREGLFRHSYLMGPDAVVAAYSYEDSPFSVREGDCSEEEVANHGMHAAELALIRRRFAEAKASLTDTRGTRPSAVPSTQPRFSCNSEGNFCAQDPPRGTVCAPCVRGSVDDRRAAIFSRRELITREVRRCCIGLCSPCQRLMAGSLEGCISLAVASALRFCRKCMRAYATSRTPSTPSRWSNSESSSRLSLKSPATPSVSQKKKTSIRNSTGNCREGLGCA